MYFDVQNSTRCLKCKTLIWCLKFAVKLSNELKTLVLVSVSLVSVMFYILNTHILFIFALNYYVCIDFFKLDIEGPLINASSNIPQTSSAIGAHDLNSKMSWH